MDSTAPSALAAVAARIPDAARDLRLNLPSLERSEHLTPTQLWGTILASALASRRKDLIAAAAADARAHLDAAHMDAVRTAAALMAMNNVFYRFRHLVGDPIYGEIPARLRMQGMNSHGAAHADFELWSIAVSAVNGCGMCMETHEKKLRGQGVPPQAVHDAVRIAAVMFAVAQVLDHEDGLAG